jgi:protein ImuA
MSVSHPNSILPNISAVVAQMPHAVWRGNQMASYPATVAPTGYRVLDAELPNGGWPKSALIELLLQQQGIGEMQLLRPALATIARRQRIALIQPPYLPQVAAWSGWGLPAEHLLWLKTKSSADALWSTEQILRHGSCGAVILWQSNIRSVSLRRLHLAAQGSDTVLWLIRPLANVPDASPAPLRLGLRPALGGAEVTFVKRRGPQSDATLYLPFETMPSLPLITKAPNHAFVDRPSPAVAPVGSTTAMLE